MERKRERKCVMGQVVVKENGPAINKLVKDRVFLSTRIILFFPFRCQVLSPNSARRKLWICCLEEVSWARKPYTQISQDIGGVAFEKILYRLGLRWSLPILFNQ